MGTCLTLPESYRESFHVDLQKDTKLAVLVNVLSLLLFVPFLAAGVLLFPTSLFDGGIWPLLLFAAGIVVYMVLHELIHGLFIRLFSGMRPHYGFTGLYAYAGSHAYFARGHYIVIALAPVIIWGIVLAVLCAVTWGTRWFWSLYLIEALNISGAAGDFYVTWRFLKEPKDILIQDTGIAMTVYAHHQTECGN